MKLRYKDLLGLAHLTPEEIELILHTAVPFKKLFTRSIKKVPPLRGKTVALLFAGSVADQAPVKSGDGFARVEEMGRELAQAAAAILDGAHPQPLGVLRARQERMPLPPARVRLGRLSLPRWLGSQFVDDDATLSVVEAGSTVFFGVPCDLAASLGLRLKRAARAQELQPMVIGFASDYIGYCVPESLYDAKQYESSMAFNGPKAGELVVERLIQMLDDR